MIEVISKAFDVVAQFFGYTKHRSELNNTPEMKKRAEAQAENKQDDKDANAIKNRDEKAAQDALS